MIMMINTERSWSIYRMQLPVDHCCSGNYCTECSHKLYLSLLEGSELGNPKHLPSPQGTWPRICVWFYGHMVWRWNIILPHVLTAYWQVFLWRNIPMKYESSMWLFHRLSGCSLFYPLQKLSKNGLGSLSGQSPRVLESCSTSPEAIWAAKLDIYQLLLNFQILGRDVKEPGHKVLDQI